MLAGTVPAYM